MASTIPSTIHQRLRMGNGVLDRLKDLGRATGDAAGRAAAAVTSIDARDAAASAASWIAQSCNLALASDLAGAADRWMHHTFKSATTAYDRAMDAEYIRTHIGGGLHRLFDGGHDLLGAWRAARDAVPDDTRIEEIQGYLIGLWHDVVTPMGLPVVTWDIETYRAFSATLQHALHVSPGWVSDMASYTATELGGSIAGVASLLLNLQRNDVARYAELCASLSISGAAGGNPVLVAIAIVAALKGAHEAHKTGEWSKWGVAVGKGAATTGVSAGVIALVGGMTGGVLAIPAAICTKVALDKLEKLARRRFAAVSIAAFETEMRMTLQALPAPEVMLSLERPRPAGTE